MAIAEPERRVILSYQATMRRVRDAVERFLRTTWTGMDAYRDADIDRMVARVVPVVMGGQRQVAALTSAYLAAVASAVLGERAAPVPTGNLTDFRGVPADEVYRRPGIVVWSALAEGKPLGAAVNGGLVRLMSIADTDLQLAKTHAAQRVLSADQRAVGFQRVLTGVENCALCALVSTRRYHREDLMPIHPGCDCDVRPLYGDEDPGQVIDADRLERIHREVERQTGKSSRSGTDYGDVVIREHGEYGPTLSWADHGFTGPSDIQASA